jgi:hypothetical protein
MQTIEVAKTIDITPTWEQILPTLLVVYVNAGTHKGKKAATDELRRMAQYADRYVASQTTEKK